MACLVRTGARENARNVRDPARSERSPSPRAFTGASFAMAPRIPANA